jgi:hypothetical protein
MVSAAAGPTGERRLHEQAYVLVPGAGVDGFTAPTVREATAASCRADGWVLLALDGGRRQWAMPLLGRGAAVTAPPRVAQAVAVRVLTGLGVHVRAWHGIGSADQAVYRAELVAPPESAPAHRGRRWDEPFSAPATARSPVANVSRARRVRRRVPLLRRAPRPDRQPWQGS